jgi:ligand-binding SRPBCC domain-containing protein
MYIRPAATHTTLHCEQWVPQPLDQVFIFFADAYNLERITPPFLRFSVRSINTTAIQQGTEITYRLRLHRLPISWTSRIEAWEPPYRFTDVQTRGPFDLWSHQHEFTAGDRGTSMRDTVHYRVPCTWLQRFRLLSWADRDLERIFNLPSAGHRTAVRRSGALSIGVYRSHPHLRRNHARMGSQSMRTAVLLVDRKE